jgi:hypothetical protein
LFDAWVAPVVRGIDIDECRERDLGDRDAADVDAAGNVRRPLVALEQQLRFGEADVDHVLVEGEILALADALHDEPFEVLELVARGGE